jgi:hypothetical protein
MNDSFLVRVVDRVTDFPEEREPVLGREAFAVAVLHERGFSPVHMPSIR